MNPDVPGHRPALTLLEVVIALVTLVIAASAILGGVSFAASLSVRDQKRLEGVEVAHRVILQQIEDPEILKGQLKRAEINGRYYAFTLDEEVVRTGDAPTGAAGSKVRYNATRLAETQGDDRIKPLNRLTVRVFEDDDNTGPGGKPAIAELSRYYSWIGGTTDEDDMIKEVSRRFGAQLDRAGLGTPAPSGGKK